MRMVTHPSMNSNGITAVRAKEKVENAKKKNRNKNKKKKKR